MVITSYLFIGYLSTVNLRLLQFAVTTVWQLAPRDTALKMTATQVDFVFVFLNKFASIDSLFELIREQSFGSCLEQKSQPVGELSSSKVTMSGKLSERFAQIKKTVVGSGDRHDQNRKFRVQQNTQRQADQRKSQVNTRRGLSNQAQQQQRGGNGRPTSAGTISPPLVVLVLVF